MDETITPQEGTSPESEVGIEETTVEETTETPDIEDVETLRAELEKERQARQQLTARAKKAEEALKKGIQAKPQLTQNALSETDIEVKILKAQGKSDDEINYLKKLAAVNQTGLLDAQSDELYTAYQKRKDDEAKAQKARLGASRGSGSVKKEKDLTSAGLTDEEHKALWLERQGR